MAMSKSVLVASTTLVVAAAHSSHAAFGPGIGTPACSKRVALTIGPVMASWVAVRVQSFTRFAPEDPRVRIF
jgi:hypothetical protein